MKKRPKTSNDWLKEIMLNVGCGGVAEKVPDGWMTIKEMAEAMGVVTTTMNGRVQRAIVRGQIQRKKYRINTDAGVTAVWHYFPVK